MSVQATKRGFWDVIIGYFRDFRVLKETRSEYWGTQLINFMDCTIYFAMITISTVFLTYDLGFSDEHAGYVVTLFTSATTIFLFVSGMITDWLGIRVSIYVAMGGLLVLRLIVAAAGLIDTFPYRGPVVVLAFFLMAPFMAMIQTVFQAANRRFTTKRSRSAGFNLWYLFMNVGAAAGGFLVDIVRIWLKIPNAHIFSLGVVSAVICILVAALMIKREEQLRSPDEPEEDEPEVVERKNPFQIAREVVSAPAFWRLLVLIVLTLGVRAIFSYMYLLWPKYWIRVIGQDAAIGTLNTINPILIVIGLFLFIPIANKFNIFKMLIFGAMISASSLFVLMIPWRLVSDDLGTACYILSVAALVVLSIGEIIWSPKLSEYTAVVAPPGQEGTYLGLTMVPWFLAKTVVSLLSGHMLERWVPEGIGEQLRAGTVSFWDSPSALWLILGIFAISGPILALLLKDWLTAGVKLEPKKDTA